MAALKTRVLHIFLLISFLPTVARLRVEAMGTHVSRSIGAYATDPGLIWNTFLVRTREQSMDLASRWMGAETATYAN
jgi:hypothetical protein